MGIGLVSFAPPGLVGSSDTLTHGLRRGLHSFAPSELASSRSRCSSKRRADTELADIGRGWVWGVGG